MEGERGAHTPLTGMMPIEVTAYEEESDWISRSKMVHIFGKRDVNGVITVWWTVQHTYKHEVGVEGKL